MELNTSWVQRSILFIVNRLRPDSAKTSLCREDLKRQSVSAWQPSLHSFASLINTFLPLGRRELLYWWKEPHTVKSPKCHQLRDFTRGLARSTGCSFPLFPSEYLGVESKSVSWQRVTHTGCLASLARSVIGHLAESSRVPFVYQIPDIHLWCGLLPHSYVWEQTQQAQVTHGCCWSQLKEASWTNTFRSQVHV